MKMNPPIFNGMHCTLESVGRTDNWGNFEANLSNDEGEKIRIKKMSTHFFLNETGKAPEGVDWRTIGEQFDFGYAMTVHKAQGSEAGTVFIFGQGFGKPDERAKWLYTAITRAKKRLFICGDRI
jgi:exodeoxyribonuclease-5